MEGEGIGRAANGLYIISNTTIVNNIVIIAQRPTTSTDFVTKFVYDSVVDSANLDIVLWH